MSEFEMTKAQALNGKYIPLPESGNVIINALRIRLITDESDLQLFERTIIKVLKSDGNLGAGGTVYEYEYNSNDKTFDPNSSEKLHSNKHGYWCAFDDNMEELSNIDFTIHFQYN